MAKQWHYEGDVDVLGYGGSLARHVGGRRYHVIQFDNMDEACGSDNEGRPTYNGSLREVDLDVADIDAARQSYGYEDEDINDVGLAFMCSSYGQYAPLVQEDSNNGHKLIRSLKRESRDIEADSDRYETLMDHTPVNGMGSTAREYQTGDLDSAIQRGLRNGNEAAGIMAIMSKPRQPVSLGALTKDGQIVGEIVVDMSLTGSDDPIAFSFGFSQGVRNEPVETYDDLAPEYLRGHAEGLKVFNGGELPAYAKR